MQRMHTEINENSRYVSPILKQEKARNRIWFFENTCESLAIFIIRSAVLLDLTFSYLRFWISGWSLTSFWICEGVRGADPTFYCGLQKFWDELRLSVLFFVEIFVVFGWPRNIFVFCGFRGFSFPHQAWCWSSFLVFLLTWKVWLNERVICHCFSRACDNFIPRLCWMFCDIWSCVWVPDFLSPFRLVILFRYTALSSFVWNPRTSLL